MANTYVNKVIYGGDTLIDLTSDTAEASDVQAGKYFHLKSGERVQGTSTFDADTSDATATAAEILSTKTAYVAGNKITGSMPNRGAVTGTIATKTGSYTIPQGYHDGSGSVSLASSAVANLTAENIREGVEVLGITGTMSGSEDVKAQAKTVTPGTTAQTVTPDSPTYNYLTQVTVNAIPYTEADNAAGGKTVTIAAA